VSAIEKIQILETVGVGISYILPSFVELLQRVVVVSFGSL
jgi:hypothetical protein